MFSPVIHTIILIKIEIGWSLTRIWKLLSSDMKFVKTLHSTCLNSLSSLVSIFNKLNNRNSKKLWVFLESIQQHYIQKTFLQTKISDFFVPCANVIAVKIKSVKTTKKWKMNWILKSNRSIQSMKILNSKKINHVNHLCSHYDVLSEIQ